MSDALKAVLQSRKKSNCETGVSINKKNERNSLMHPDHSLFLHGKEQNEEEREMMLEVPRVDRFCMKRSYIHLFVRPSLERVLLGRDEYIHNLNMP